MIRSAAAAGVFIAIDVPDLCSGQTSVRNGVLCRPDSRHQAGL